MDSKYNALFTPWKIGKVEIPNRIVQCSMGGTSLFGWMEPCHLDKEAAYFLLNRAKDGVGLILPGMQCIKDAIGGRWLYQNDKMFKDLKVYMEEFHKTGAKLFVQLAAGMGRSMAITKPMVMLLEHPLLGKLVSPVADLDYITASASATPNRWYDEVKSRPMTIKEIQDQVEAFAKTSKKLMDAGVDGVEIHAVHEGYLLDQFTISNMNYRTDQYGGNVENRARLVLEVVDAGIEEWGADRIGIRISPIGTFQNTDNGPNEEADALYLIEQLGKRGIAYLHMSEPDWAGGEPYTDAFREKVRARFHGPIIGAGAYTVEKAETLIGKGLIDAVAFGRDWIANPDLVARLQRKAELNPQRAESFYGGGAEGYTDYPTL